MTGRPGIRRNWRALAVFLVLALAASAVLWLFVALIHVLVIRAALLVLQ